MKSRYFNYIPDAFTMDYRETEETILKQPHIHDLYEITLVLTDNVALNMNDTLTKIPKNSLLLFNNMDLHLITKAGEGAFCRYVLQFRPEYLEGLNQRGCDLFECFFMRPFEGAQILELNTQEYRSVRSVMERIEQIFKSSGMYGREELQRLITAEILIIIMEFIAESIP